MKQIPLIIISILALTGCSNKFATNYQSVTTVSNPLYIPTDKPVEIITSDSPEYEIKKLVENGYMIMGTSSFTARTGSQNLKNIEQHAQSVGAQYVIASRKNLGSTTVSMPFTTPTTTTSNTNYNLSNNYGKQYYGNSQTTTYGTQTQYIPVTISDTKYTAYFFGKFKNKTGVYPFELTDQDKKKIEQNVGVKVGAVVNNSPSYYSGILADDILLKINKEDVYGIKGFLEITDQLKNGETTFDIYRNGKVISKKIKIVD